MTFGRVDVDDTVQRRFEQVVSADGDRLALTGHGKQWTYRTLNEYANRLAHAIRAHTAPGVGSVAYLADQSPEMVVAAMGVLKAGKAYLAIHPGLPRAAQAEIVRDAAPDLILATEAHAARARELAAGSGRVLTLEESGDRGSIENPAPIAWPGDPATIFFTSGTTGRPKGVVRSHRAVMHRVWLSSLHEGITAADRQSLLTHCSFGASQADLAGALLLGATLCVFDVVPAGLSAFADWIDAERITLLRPPVQLFRRLLGGVDRGRRFSSVRLVSLGGDSVGRSDIEAWRQHFVAPCAMLHRFSTTETSLLTTTRIDHSTVLGPDIVTAGRPVEDKVLTLVDPDGRPVPIGETGELVVSSAYLADGYWRMPDETARAFFEDAVHPELRSYRTGDGGRLMPDGRFVFLGRLDQQVKIRGYRVEIREVETALRELDDVSDAAVVSSEQGEPRLHAFVVTSAGQAFDPVSLRRKLRLRLPEWKVPAHLHLRSSLPTTANGKLDRQRLRELAAGDLTEPPTVVAGTTLEEPIDDVEQQIAAVFRRVLDCGPVERSADFFLLGGNSLQATVLHQQLEHVLALRIPLQALLKDATVRGLADAVREARQTALSGTEGRPPLLVPLRMGGAHTSLFFVHGRLGHAFVSPHILDVLGADQPVYAFQVPGLDRRRMRDNSIEEMAREYVQAMRSVQPAGPYFLGSACAGALVAVEMANQLRQASERVGPLLLIDPPVVPVGDHPWWRRGWRLARAHVGQFVPRAALAKRLAMTMRRRADEGRATLRFKDAASLERAAEAVLMFEMARLRYRRWRYDGPVLMLRSSRRLSKDGPNRRGAFGRHLFGDVQWFDVGGNHDTVRQADNEALARHLRDAVEIARRALAALRPRASEHQF